MILVLAGIFLATVSLVIGGYLFMNRRALAEADVARQRLRPEELADRTLTLLKDTRISEVDVLNRLLKGKDWVRELQLQLMRAGSPLNPGAFVMLSLASAT